MIVAKPKEFEQIREYLKPYKKVMVLGCKTCVTVCNAGGSKEVGLLCAQLKLADQKEGRSVQYVEHTLERQCDPEYLDGLKGKLDGVEAILSLGCGAGVQFTAEHNTLPVLPGVDTVFIGVAEEAGKWTERCQACGDCKLALTGGICPVARCSKSLMNGPCGGSTAGKCEISKDVACGWQLIVDRLEALDRLEDYEKILDMNDWRTSRDGGPRKVERDELKDVKQEQSQEG